MIHNLPAFGKKICADICSRTLTVPRKTASYEGQIMFKDKYTSIS